MPAIGAITTHPGSSRTGRGIVVMWQQGEQLLRVTWQLHLFEAGDEVPQRYRVIDQNSAGSVRVM
ncbi:MAG: hypothetical protein ACRDXB_00355 [Actinomycetes bacterium]